jgi:anti-anti-sigma factor
MSGEGATLMIEESVPASGGVAACLRVRLAGSLDHRMLPRLRPLLRAASCPSRSIRLDLAAVAFIDASGVGVLLALQEAVRNGGGRLDIRDPSPRVLRILKGVRVADRLLGRQAADCRQAA